MVKARLAELRRHPDDCHCGCAAARVVKPMDVYRIASTWQRQCDATRARGRRARLAGRAAGERKSRTESDGTLTGGTRQRRWPKCGTGQSDQAISVSPHQELRGAHAAPWHPAPSGGCETCSAAVEAAMLSVQVHGSTAEIPRPTDVPPGGFPDRMGSRITVHRIEEKDMSVSQALATPVDEIMESSALVPRNGFPLEPRCRVCRNDLLRKKVNDLLATGASYAMIVRATRGGQRRTRQL